MGILIDMDTVGWLRKLGIIKHHGSSPKNQTQQIEIQEPHSLHFYNGMVFAQIALKILEGKNKAAIVELKKMKDIQTPAAKVLNWNILQDVYSGWLQVEVDDDLKALLVSGDDMIIDDFLMQVYSQHSETETYHSHEEYNYKQHYQLKQQRRLQAEEIKDEETADLRQWLLDKIQANMGLTPEENRSLVKGKYRYLAHVLVKGIKANPTPIQSFLMDVTNDMAGLVSLMTTPSHLATLGHALQPGLVSKHSSNVILTNTLFLQLTHKLSPEQCQLMTHVGRHCVMGINRHPYLATMLTQTLVGFVGSDNLGVALSPRELESVVQGGTQVVLSLLRSLLLALVHLKINNLGDVFGQWVDYLKQQSCPGGIPPHCLLLVDIFVLMPHHVQEWSDQANNLIMTLKTCCQMGTAVALSACVLLFRLLDGLAEHQNLFAPLVYKTISVVVVEWYDQMEMRHMVLTNLQQFLGKDQGVPLDLIVDPYLTMVTKQFTQHPQSLNTFDLSFIIFLSQSARLVAPCTSRLFDLLQKVFLNSIIYASIAGRGILSILTLHMAQPDLRESLLRFSKLCLAIYFSLQKKLLSGGADVTVNNQKRALIVELIRQIAGLNHPEVNDKLKALVAHTHIQLKLQHKNNNPGLESILAYFGEPGRILEFYQAQLQEHSQDNSPAKDNHTETPPQTLKVLPLETHPQTLCPKPDPKVLRHLQQLQLNREQKKKAQITQEEQQRKQQEKKKANVRQQVERRGKHLGVAVNTQHCLQEIGSIQATGLVFDYLELDQEEERDTVGLKQLMQGHQKLLNNIYSLYKNKTILKKNGLTFDQISGSKINYVEVLSLVKDSVPRAVPPLDQVQKVIRRLNLLEHTQDSHYLSFLGFQGFLMQLVLFQADPTLDGGSTLYMQGMLRRFRALEREGGEQSVGAGETRHKQVECIQFSHSLHPCLAKQLSEGHHIVNAILQESLAVLGVCMNESLAEKKVVQVGPSMQARRIRRQYRQPAKGGMSQVARQAVGQVPIGAEHDMQTYSRLIVESIVQAIQNKKGNNTDGTESARQRKARDIRVNRRRQFLQKLLGNRDRQKRRVIDQHMKYKGRFNIPQWDYVARASAQRIYRGTTKKKNVQFKEKSLHLVQREKRNFERKQQMLEEQQLIQEQKAEQREEFEAFNQEQIEKQQEKFREMKEQEQRAREEREKKEKEKKARQQDYRRTVLPSKLEKEAQKRESLHQSHHKIRQLQQLAQVQSYLVSQEKQTQRLYLLLAKTETRLGTEPSGLGYEALRMFCVGFGLCPEVLSQKSVYLLHNHYLKERAQGLDYTLFLDFLLRLALLHDYHSQKEFLPKQSPSQPQSVFEYPGLDSFEVAVLQALFQFLGLDQPFQNMTQIDSFLASKISSTPAKNNKVRKIQMQRVTRKEPEKEGERTDGPVQ